MLKRPMTASAVMPWFALKPRSTRYAGRCVMTKMVWKPQTKKLAVSSQKPRC